MPANHTSQHPSQKHQRPSCKRTRPFSGSGASNGHKKRTRPHLWHRRPATPAAPKLETRPHIWQRHSAIAPAPKFESACLPVALYSTLCWADVQRSTAGWSLERSMAWSSWRSWQPFKMSLALKTRSLRHRQRHYGGGGARHCGEGGAACCGGGGGCWCRSRPWTRRRVSSSKAQMATHLAQHKLQRAHGHTSGSPAPKLTRPHIWQRPWSALHPGSKTHTAVHLAAPCKGPVISGKRYLTIYTFLI